jgi:hypothetical protein
VQAPGVVGAGTGVPDTGSHWLQYVATAFVKVSMGAVALWACPKGLGCVVVPEEVLVELQPAKRSAIAVRAMIAGRMRGAHRTRFINVAVQTRNGTAHDDATA